MVAGIGALLSGVGSIAGSFMGASAQREANKQNEMQSLMNYMMRMQERQDMLEAAEEAKKMSREGTTDAAGTRTRYIPGRGWITELTREGEEMRQAQRAEQMRTLYRDMPMKRRALEANEEMQVGERAQAQNILEQMNREKIDPKLIQAEMTLGARQGVNQGVDEVTNAAMRNAMRTGSSNVGNILAKLGEGRGQALSQATANIPTQARQTAAQLESGRRGGLANLYNMFASRASAMPGVGYAPQNIEGTANQMLGSNMAGGANAMSNMIRALQQPGPSLQPVQPDDYMAKAVTNSGAALGNIADAFTGQREKDILMKAYGNRFSSGGGWTGPG